MNSENNKPLWPTLEGRLKHSIKDTLTALKQMKENKDVLTPLAEKIMSKLKSEQILKSKKKYKKI